MLSTCDSLTITLTILSASTALDMTFKREMFRITDYVPSLAIRLDNLTHGVCAQRTLVAEDDRTRREVEIQVVRKE
jgi:hypothetical protein